MLPFSLVLDAEEVFIQDYSNFSGKTAHFNCHVYNSVHSKVQVVLQSHDELAVMSDLTSSSHARNFWMPEDDCIKF